MRCLRYLDPLSVIIILEINMMCRADAMKVISGGAKIGRIFYTLFDLST
jgi:hypothetical protein